MYVRPFFYKLEEKIKEKRRFIQVILGPRQVGKTTLILQLLEKNLLPSYFVSGDESSGKSTWIDQQWESARFIAKKTASSKGCLFVIDEIQKIQNWSETVKKNWDEDSRNKIPVKVILLGSSSLLLQKGLTESLSGRFETLHLSHWSYTEMKEAFKFSPEEYVWFGGYPGAAELIMEPQRWKDYILHSLIETTISKDILMMTRVDKPALLKQLFELSCLYSGQIFSYNKMLGQLADAGNTTTLAHYLKLLDYSGLVAGLEKFSSKPLKTRSSSPKLMVLNPAVFSVYKATSFDETMKNPADWGRHIEKTVGAHLMSHSITNGYKVFYWRQENDEVDFVLEKNKKIIALEVKSGKKNNTIGIDVFAKQYKPFKTIMVGDSGIPWKEFIKYDPGELF